MFLKKDLEILRNGYKKRRCHSPNSQYLGDSFQDFPVVDFGGDRDTQSFRHIFHQVNDLRFTGQGISTHHICITLVKFPVTTLLWTISTPYRLDLVSLEREGNFMLIHNNVSCKWDRQIIPQTFF